MYICSKEANSITKIWITLLPLLESVYMLYVTKYLKDPNSTPALARECEYGLNKQRILKDIANTPALARECIYAQNNRIIS